MASRWAKAGVERQLSRLEKPLWTGLRLIQVRDKGLAFAQRLGFAEAVRRIAEQRGALVLINDDEDIAQRIGADGLHLSAAARGMHAATGLRLGPAPPATMPTNCAALYRLGLDTLLGPVLPTPTHPDATGLGWPSLRRLITGTPYRCSRSAG